MTVVNTVPPTISGTPRLGQTLHSSPGSWTFDLDELVYAYQWERCDSLGASCVDIAGANGSNYVLTSADVGSTIRVEVTGTEVAAPDLGAYFVSDWNDGLIGYIPGQFDDGYPWATIFSYTPPTFLDVGLFGGSPVSSSPEGRVAVVANPFGSGNVLKCEIRDSDPFPSSLAKAELGSVEQATFDGGTFVIGAEIWITMELYFGSDFGCAFGGTNPFTTIADLHTASGSGIPTLGLGGYSTTNIQMHAGVQGQIQRFDFIPLISANRNRKVSVALGAKISPSGWVEGWVDGVNIVPRRNLAMCAADESGPYWKQGLYSQSDASWPGGRSVIYHGATRMYTSRPF